MEDSQKIQELNQLRDGIFQVAMLLYKEYSRYMDPADARVCVYRDMQEKAKQFIDGKIDDVDTASLAKKAIEAKIKEIEKSIKKAKDSDIQLRLCEDVDTLTEALGILKA